MRQPSHSELQRDVGRVEGTLAAVEKRLDRIEESLSEGLGKIEGLLSDALEKGHERHSALDSRIGELEKAEERRKGWLAATTSIASLIAGAIVWLANKLF